MRSGYFVLFISFVLFGQPVFAQDPIFTDPTYAISSMNPALTGAYGCFRADFVNRAQWPKLAGNYNTTVIGTDYASRIGNIGWQFYMDVAGEVLTTFRQDLNYSFPFRLWKDSTGVGKVVLQPGIQISYHTVGINWDALTFNDQIDPQLGFVYSTSNYPAGTTWRSNIDFSAGLLVYHNRFSIGVAAFHLTEPNQGFRGNSPLPMRFVLHMSGVIWNADPELMESFRLVPSVYYSKQGDFEVFRTTVSAFYKGFHTGVGYSNRDAVFISLGYSRWGCTISYSYDYTISELKGLTGGSHEIRFRVLPLHIVPRGKTPELARSNMRMHF